MIRIISILFLLAIIGCRPVHELDEIEKWAVYEIELRGPDSGNPFMEVELAADFQNGQETVRVPGFYDGQGVYRIRFSPSIEGNWSYATNSNISDLSDQHGSFNCIAPIGNNHGPVKIVNTFYLQYADGTPYYAVGTTAYQWTSVKQSVQEKTLETLSGAPFNKIRMCVFPKRYIYGNESEPWIYPFHRTDGNNDLSQPNFEFFQNFDRRVSQLLEMEIQADVILFHPYDDWGYDKMGKEMNEKYVRYMIARLSAYRNVWWSLANEWDIPEFKEAIDWEGIGTLLQEEDPHKRFRGIHNWYDSEDHFYDHTRPWITHTSTQTAQFYHADKWREQYQQPLLFDEMRYEGDVPSGWGNLSAEEMSSYFWMAGLSGGYGTHGDTYHNKADDETEVRWWAKGGELVGDSPERIRFFREQMEKAPVHEMTPHFSDGGDPKNLETNIYTLSKPGEYYLAYTAATGRKIALELTGNADYKVEVLDTWNMQVVEEATASPGMFHYLTEKPYSALRLTVIR